MSAAGARIFGLAMASMLIGGAMGCGAAWAGTKPIDDTGTVTLQPTVGMRWQELSPRRRASSLMEGTTRLRVRR